MALRAVEETGDRLWSKLSRPLWGHPPLSAARSFLGLQNKLIEYIPMVTPYSHEGCSSLTDVSNFGLDIFVISLMAGLSLISWKLVVITLLGMTSWTAHAFAPNKTMIPSNWIECMMERTRLIYGKFRNYAACCDLTHTRSLPSTCIRGVGEAWIH